jgi:hypothetical protein
MMVGILHHIMHVVKNSLRMMKTFQDAGANIDFTQEELLFSAFHHDLGKLGTVGKIHYIPNDSEWHVKNRGEYYKRNNENTYMTLTDRTFFLLNLYGISYSEKEYFGIKLTDGMYDDDNIKYLKTYNSNDTIKTHMYAILHFADAMSSAIERNELLNL